MKTVGLITEYNPFHNGHKYHIEEAKKLTGADAVIVVMSGDFVQRGTPAIMDKFMRAKASILNGADLVFELPTCFATASAEFFAEGAIRLLDKLGVVNSVCFGSECGDINILSGIAEVLLNEPADFKESLQSKLRTGSNFAKARADAFFECYPEYYEIIKSPNNILGIEYIKAIKKIHSNIVPCTITRKGNDYHDKALNHALSSATAIRKLIIDTNLSAAAIDDCFMHFVPENVADLYDEAFDNSFPLTEEDFSSMLYYKLLNDVNNALPLSKYFEVSEELANRIVRLLPEYTGFSDFAMLLKNKSLTYSRICRGLIHILLGIESTDIDKFKASEWVFYAKLLAMSSKPQSNDILKDISQNSSLALITVGKTLKKVLSDDTLNSLGKKQLYMDSLADNLYQHVAGMKFNSKPISELSRNFIRL